MIAFETLKLKPSPNQFLMAPERLCKQARPHRVSPVYPLPLARLEEGWARMLERQPRVEIVAADLRAHRHEVIQRTRVFGFRDRITVQFFSEYEDRSSTLAIYSRSETGYSDLGVNRRRVEGWLDALEETLAVNVGQRPDSWL